MPQVTVAAGNAPLAPVRETVNVTLPPLSATVAALELNCAVPAATARSLSVIVTTASAGVPSSAPPVGALNTTEKDSVLSTAPSSTIVTEMFLAVVSPATQLNVPGVAV